MYIILLSFTLYCDPLTSLCKLVANSIYPPVCSIFTNRKGVCIWQYVVSLSNNLSSVVLLCPPVFCTSVTKFSWVHLRSLILNGGINLGAPLPEYDRSIAWRISIYNINSVDRRFWWHTTLCYSCW